MSLATYCPFVLVVCQCIFFGIMAVSTKRSIISTVDVAVFEENSTHSEIFDLKKYLKSSKNKLADQEYEATLVFSDEERGHLLRFDPESKKLFVAERLDREEICPVTSERCILPVELHFSSLHFSGIDILKLHLEILDVNDHAPEFNDKTFETHVSEQTSPGIIFQMPSAIDLDYGKNAEVTYSLRPSSSMFRLNEQRDSRNKIVDLRLELLSPLDRETTNLHRITVVATDNGQPPMSGSASINIYVEDENDNLPIYDSPSYSAQVRPEDPVGLTVLTVKANDKDEGQNSRIRYFFPKKTLTVYGRLFTINGETGEIKLASKLGEYSHLQPPFHLVVAAEDFGPNQIPVTTNVTINVVNSNNHAPVISLSSHFLGSDANNLIVEENNAPNSVVGNIVVNDQDVGPSGLVECRLTDESTFEVVRFHGSVFNLIIKHPLDRESKWLHKIEVECEDMGQPPLTSYLTVNVMVTDFDDNPPHFSKPLYSAQFYENNPIGTSILKLEIQDLDTDAANVRTHLFVEPHFEHLFAVDQTSRDLLALVSFDREQTDRYSFHVFAKGGKLPEDNSSYRHVTKTLVNLTVLDVNDELPRFVQPWFKFHVVENMPAGFVVGKVKAVDLDLPPNNIFHYSLQPGATSHRKTFPAHLGHHVEKKQPTPDFPFDIDPLSGAIVTTMVLDREQQSRHEFSVQVANDSAKVFVDVTDVNDNSPQWTFPKADSCQNIENLRLRGNLTFAQQLTKIVATDKDAGKNAEVTYAITSGNEQNQFSLEAKSGKLSWNSYLSGFINHNQCRTKLTFKAHDSGEPSMYSESACLEVTFEECLSHHERLQATSPSMSKETAEGSQTKSAFSDFYLIIVVVVLVCCIVIAIVLTAAICITKQQTRALKREKFRNSDLRASIPLAGPDNEAVLVLDRSTANESSDQLTGILVSLRSAEQLGRLQLRSMAPSKDSLMSTSISLHRERDADSGYADVSPV